MTRRTWQLVDESGAEEGGDAGLTQSQAGARDITEKVGKAPIAIHHAPTPARLALAVHWSTTAPALDGLSTTTSAMSQTWAASLSSPNSLVWLLLLSAFSYLLWTVYSRPRPHPTLRSVAILVLGDIGRSPRMMYHAESFATNKFQTYIVGYGGENTSLGLVDAHPSGGASRIVTFV